MAKLPEFTRLMALALLNYADDEGYFHANPVLLRGSLFPFLDDSGKIPGAIHDLSGVGYLQLGSDDKGREVGKIVSFLKHQRVEKPRASSIKPLAIFPDASPKPTGKLPDASRGEWNGMDQGKGSRKRKGKGPGKPPAAAAAIPPPSAPAAKAAKSKRPVTTVDDAWIAELQAGEAYAGIDVATELARAEQWLTNNSPARNFSRKFCINWLNRVERRAAITGKPAPDSPLRGAHPQGEWKGPTLAEMLKKAEEGEF